MIPHGYLIHHGIIGQKWGIRRYQNADGSLTDAGKKRYNHELADIGIAQSKVRSSGDDYYNKKSIAREHYGNREILQGVATQVKADSAWKRYKADKAEYERKLADSMAYKNAIKIAKEYTKNNPDNSKANDILSKFYGDRKKLTKEELDYAYKHLDTLSTNYGKAVHNAEKFLDDYLDDLSANYTHKRMAKNEIARLVELDAMRNDYDTMMALGELLRDNKRKVPKSAYVYL
jgi:hypothetical protein